MSYRILKVKEFTRLHDRSETPKDHPFTTRQLLKVLGFEVNGKDIVDTTTFEEAYTAVAEFENKYGTSKEFSTHTRARFLFWVISLGSGKSTRWTG